MIDLRSDTVTLPTEEMREAMRRAELGDDSREGDPTVRRLEEAAAKITGKEAALFVASGTMSNLVALLAHTGRGGEVLLDGDCHIMRSEMGGIASLAGVVYCPSPSKGGAAGLDHIRRRVGGLADDHRRAKRMAEGLHAIDPRLTDPRLVDTNIVMIEVGHTGSDAKTWIAALQEAGLSSGAWSRTSLRLVTHRHIDDAAVEQTIAIFPSVVDALRPSQAESL